MTPVETTFLLAARWIAAYDAARKTLRECEDHLAFIHSAGVQAANVEKLVANTRALLADPTVEWTALILHRQHMSERRWAIIEPAFAALVSERPELAEYYRLADINVDR